MLRLLVWAASALIGYQIIYTAVCFRRNLNKARRSGLKYVVAPVFFLNTLWLTSHRLLLPAFGRLPRQWVAWLDFCVPDFGFINRNEIFKRLGHDTFLIVTPGGNIMYTCDPGMVSQITTRRNDFPKPTSIYTLLDIYGRNVVTSEGDHWRLHRKAISPSFTEKNNHLVWRETIDQASAMLASWLGTDKKGSNVVDRVADDTMRLSLHVISRAGFGRKLKWPEADAAIKTDDYKDPSKIQNEEDAVTEGHSMSYTYAIHCLLDNIIVQFLMPRWMLRHLPIKTLNKANEAYLEWGSYMQEAIDWKRNEVEEGKPNENESMDIMGQLVKGQLQTKDAANRLPDKELLGNMFVLILAGHETVANNIHFSIVYLALYPESQRRLQRDLDEIFQGRSPEKWDYDRDLPQLFGSMAGAVMNEVLRILPPVPDVPKSTWGVGDQQVTINGETKFVPGGTYIGMSTFGTHRNPRAWPAGKPRYPGGRPAHPISNVDNDLEEFRPERWLLSDSASATAARPTMENEKSGSGHMPTEVSAGGDLNINEAADTSERLYKPGKGAYIPFSDGYRSCIGRRFAQVEALAALAVIFQNYSVELAVDKYATDAEVIKMDTDARAEVWQKAAEDARELLLNGMAVIISLQMRKGHVPLRMIPRGQEKFSDDVDEVWKRNHPERCRTEGIEGWRAWNVTAPYHTNGTS
jgi:cytochrome P450